MILVTHTVTHMNARTENRYLARKIESLHALITRARLKNSNLEELLIMYERTDAD